MGTGESRAEHYLRNQAPADPGKLEEVVRTTFGALILNDQYPNFQVALGQTRWGRQG